MAKMKIPKEFFSAMEMFSEESLLEWVRQHSSLPTLKQIAANDYGEEVSDHLIAIQRQLSANPFRGLLPWCPREVLELERWNEPNSGVRKDATEARIAHIRRLLACALLLRSAVSIDVGTLSSDEAFFLDTSATTLLRLTASASALGQEVASRALQFLLWTYQKLNYEPLMPFISFCLLLLWFDTELFSRDTDDIQNVITWVIEQELYVRKVYGQQIKSEGWLLGLNYYEHDRNEYWINAAKQILDKKRLRSNEYELVGQLINRLR